MTRTEEGRKKVRQEEKKERNELKKAGRKTGRRRRNERTEEGRKKGRQERERDTLSNFPDFVSMMHVMP